jgi:hypothetical protein
MGLLFSEWVNEAQETASSGVWGCEFSVLQGLEIWHDCRMRQHRRRCDTYSFPGFRPNPINRLSGSARLKMLAIGSWKNSIGAWDPSARTTTLIEISPFEISQIGRNLDAHKASSMRIPDLIFRGELRLILMVSLRSTHSTNGISLAHAYGLATKL